MKKLILWVVAGVAVVVGAVVSVWFFNPFDVRDRLLVAQIVKMRVAPTRL